MEELQMNSDISMNKNLGEILRRMNSMEDRIALLESDKKYRAETRPVNTESNNADDSQFMNVDFTFSAPFENKLGEFGLAWLGNIVLFFAIAFIWEYFNKAGNPLVALGVGIISTICVFAVSYYFRKSYTYLSYTFGLFGFLILYYILLRLHFFNANPLIANKAVATTVLMFAVGIQLYYAIKRQMKVLAGLAFTMAMFTAFVCYQTHAFFLISIATTGLAIYTFWHYNWWKNLVYVLLISLFIYLIWLLKNPVSLVKTPGDLTYHYTFVYLSIITAMYSLVAFRKPGQGFPQNSILGIILFAGFTYSVLLLVLIILHFPQAFVPFFLAISLYCIAYSIILKFYSPWKYTPALYALFGFVAISVAVFGTYHFPDSFLLLVGQSFLVLTLALWYRSHIITLMNTFLLVILAIYYYSTSGTLQTVNFAIPLVALLSARIINWQKNRLNIKTDFIRNIYLLTLFFSLLYATYKGIPAQYITVSWLLIAGIYFGLSIILNNFKYRWMAMANLLVSAFHLVLADLAKIDIVYRILAFLVFAIISIIISVYYVKKLKNKELDTKEE
jgi:hypothetical protein